MKLATFRVDTPIGAFDRFGIVRLDGGAKDIVSSARAGAGWVIDANAAYAAFTADRGKANARIRADTFCPADLNACVQVYGPSLDPVLEMSDWLDRRWDAITHDQINEVLNEHFGDWHPAGTLVAINNLSAPGARIELDMIAVIPSDKK